MKKVEEKPKTYRSAEVIFKEYPTEQDRNELYAYMCEEFFKEMKKLFTEPEPKNLIKVDFKKRA